MKLKIPAFLHRFSSPKHFYTMSGTLLPWVGFAALTFVMVGLFLGFVIAPTHSEQGESYRIIFLHVPSSSNSMMIYTMMAFSSAIYLIWRIKLADTIAAAAAPIGAAFTFLALATGSIWGKPTWGTWWQWDARLTSELILLFLYLGYIALRSAIDDEQNRARASGLLALVGVINIPIIHFSVEWWNTLHQGMTVSKVAKPSMESTMLTAMLLTMIGLSLLFVFVTLVRGRGLVLTQNLRAGWVKELPKKPVRFFHFLIPVIGLGVIGYLAATTVQPTILTTAEVVSLQSDQTVQFRGQVEKIESNGQEHTILVQDRDQAGKKLTINFYGNLPKQLRTHWGVEVTGDYSAGQKNITAQKLAALNIRDHTMYVVAAYGIGFLALLLSLIGAWRFEKEAKQRVARVVRQSQNK